MITRTGFAWLALSLALFSFSVPPRLCAQLAPASDLPPQGQDRDWDIIRRSTEYLSFQAQATAQRDGSPAVRNLYRAYLRFRTSRSLSLANALEINSMLRQNGAEAGHVEDKGGGGLRTQNVGFFN